MIKKKNIYMPLKNVKKTLAYFDLKYTAKKLPTGDCTQLLLLTEGLDHININAYATGTVVIQPYNDDVATRLAFFFTLRARKLLRKGKIKPR